METVCAIPGFRGLLEGLITSTSQHTKKEVVMSTASNIIRLKDRYTYLTYSLTGKPNAACLYAPGNFLPDQSKKT